MRWIGRLAVAAIAVVLIAFAVANRDAVTLRLVPDIPPLEFVPTVNAPLFAVLFAALFAGYLIGTLIEWTRGFGGRGSRRDSRD